ncbi:MAG TPA: restriction endonuclease [Bacillus sp. (in: firmicutes)]|nr:restriction endonuclease [Bacillus sp. (in: firmicutes)]
MTKKDKKTISSTLAGIHLLVVLYLYWIVFESTNVYLFFAILISTPLVEVIIYGLLPSKKAKKKATSSGRKRTNKKTVTSSVAPNRLRSDKDILTTPLHELSWREFERLCYLYFKAKGYKPRETSEGADGGVDLIIYNRHHQAEEAIQIKHYINSGNRITVTAIRELNSAKRNHGCILARFITTSSYTQDALREADDFKIECRGIDWVENNIVKWQQQEAIKQNLLNRAN